MKSRLSVQMDLELQATMENTNVPHKENVRFIHLDDFMDIFDLDSDTRKEIDNLKSIIEKAADKRLGLEELYELYSEEYNYLQKAHTDYGVGRRLLSNLPF